MTDRGGRRIVSAVSNPAAHCGLNREEFVAHENLPFRGWDNGALANREILRLRDPRGPGDKNHLTIDHLGRELLFACAYKFERGSGGSQAQVRTRGHVGPRSYPPGGTMLRSAVVRNST